MATGIINKIEYRIVGSSTWLELSSTGYSGNFETNMIRTRSGLKYTSTIRAKISSVSDYNSETITGITGRKLEIKITDGDGFIHHFGTSSYPARLSFSGAIGGVPGSWNGYELTFAQESPIHHVIE
jgi:hypothetical protein